MMRVLVVSLCAVLLAACQQMPSKGRTSATAQTTAAQPAAASQPRSAGVEFRLAQSQPANGLRPLQVGNQTLHYLPSPVMTGSDLVRAVPMKSKQGQPFVRFEFSPQGAQRLAGLTQRNVGRWLLITVNGNLVAAPRIGGPMTGGVMNMSTDTERNAVLIANEVNGSVSSPAGRK
ncbi:SecDF P1 head subdomain-containing protein [Castellaniella sp. WN]